MKLLSAYPRREREKTMRKTLAWLLVLALLLGGCGKMAGKSEKTAEPETVAGVDAKTGAWIGKGGCWKLAGTDYPKSCQFSFPYKGERCYIIMDWMENRILLGERELCRPDGMIGGADAGPDGIWYSIESRAEFITYAKSLIKSIGNNELRNQYVKLLAERFDTSRSLNDVNQIRIKHKPTEAQEAAQKTLEEEVKMVPWNLIPPMEIRFANLLFRNPTLLDRACEFFDMNLAESGIQLLESSIVDEFVNTLIAHYAETGYFSPQTLYSLLPRQLQLFMEGLPEESWTPPKEIHEFYDSLMVLTLRFCDRAKKNITLESPEGIRQRMDLYNFAQEMQNLDKSYKKGSLTINDFADRIISSKERLIHVIHQEPQG